MGSPPRAAFRAACAEADEVGATGQSPLPNLIDRLAAALGPGPHTDYNAFLEHVQADAEKHNVKLTAKRLKLLQSALAQRDEAAAPVIKKTHKPGKAEANPLHGRYYLPPPAGGRGAGGEGVVEYEPDSDLRDTEQVPLLEDGGIEAFIKREVWPHVPDAWVDEAAAKIGYEISFTRYFYRPQPLRAGRDSGRDSGPGNRDGGSAE